MNELRQDVNIRPSVAILSQLVDNLSTSCDRGTSWQRVPFPGQGDMMIPRPILTTYQRHRCPVLEVHAHF